MKRLSLLLSILSFLFIAHSTFAAVPNGPSNGDIEIISRTVLETKLKITWQDNSDNEDLFIIFNYLNGVVGDYLNEFPPKDATEQIISLSNLDRGSTVQYIIGAYNSEDGVSSFGALTPEVTITADSIIRYEHEANVGAPFSTELYTDAFDLQNFASVTGLPDWASFTAATRTISGIPTTEGVHSLDLSVNYSDGFSIAETILLKVTRTPDSIIRYGFEATVGAPFSAELYTDNYGLQSSVNVTDLPSWATFTSATRTLSGTPTAEGVHFLNLSVNYSYGFSISETIPLRILPAAAGPRFSSTLPSLQYYPGAGAQIIDLNTYFEDPDCTRAARMTFNVDIGSVDVILYENATPATVANFLAYVNGTGAGAYDGAIIHRLIPNFVIQGGGYRPTGGSAFQSVTDLAPVANEPGLENVRGTLSMAKLGGDPNSATNEWFVSLGDNRANLDFQNGGFTVFARIAGNGMTVVDSIAALPRGNYNAITVDGNNRAGLLSDCPINAATAPDEMEQDQLVRIVSAVEVAPLAYAVVSNSDTTVATASIEDGSLKITPLAAGACTVRVSVTDLDNNVIERDISVAVGWTFAKWIEASGLTVEDGLLDDADGDQFSNFIEYNLMGDLENPDAALAQQTEVSFGAPTKDYLAIEFSTRSGIEDTVIVAEAINALVADPIWAEVWNSTDGAQGAQVHSSSAGAESIDWVIRDAQAMDASTQRFMRVRVQALAE